MGVLLDYKDTVQLISTHLSSDGYGTEIIDEIHDVTGLFLENTGISHGNYRTEVTADAEVYLDPTDSFVEENAYRLEGMYVVCNRFGGTEALQWYRIEQVIIGEDKLLGNTIDNVNCQLKKTSEVPGVS
jgi:hypothetical protein